MKFTAAIISLTASAILTLAAPAPEGAAEAREVLEKRDLSVRVCEVA